MRALLMIALLASAVPVAALAQAGNNMREPNLANPQADANRQNQPPNAHEPTSGPGYGQAQSIPTPTLDRKLTPITPPQRR